MAAQAAQPNKVALEFSVNSQPWRAVREHPSGWDCPGWYFINVTKRETVRVPPSGKYTPEGIFPQGIDINNPLVVAQSLDAWYLKDHPGATLVKLMTEDERAAYKRDFAARPYATAFPNDAKLEPLHPSTNEQLLGPTSWTHYSFGSSVGKDASAFPAHAGTANSRLFQAVADAIAFSDPDEPAWGQDEQIAWYQIVSELKKAEASPLQPGLLQKLAAAPSAIGASPPARASLAEVVTATDRADGAQAAMLANILQRFKPAEYGKAAGAGADASSTAGNGSMTRSVSFAVAAEGEVDRAGKAGTGTGVGAAGSEAELGADEIAVSRLVHEFTGLYTQANVGRKLMQAPPAKLASALQGVAGSKSWRGAVLALLEQDTGAERPVDDPFLQRFARVAAEGDASRRADMAAVPVLAGDVPFASRIAADSVVAAAVGAGAETVGEYAVKCTGAAFSDSSRPALAPALATELAALIASDVSAAVVSSLATDAAGSESGQAKATAGLVDEPTAMFAALRAARSRQELGFTLLGKPGALPSSALAATPADPYLLLMATVYVQALQAAPASGPYEAGLRLRRLALLFWSSHRGRREFFPEEGSERIDASSAAAAVVATSVAAVRPQDRPADTGTDVPTVPGESVAGQDLVGKELEERAIKAGAVKCLSKEQVSDIARCVTDLFPFILDSASYAQYVQEREELKAAIASVEAAAAAAESVPDDQMATAQAAASKAETISMLLAGHAFVLRLFRCPDVLILLLHALFHPGVPIDDPAAEANGAQAVSHTLALALAWAASIAGVHGERRDVTGMVHDAGALPSLAQGDSGLTAAFLSVPLAQGGSVYMAGHSGSTSIPAWDESLAIQALAQRMGEAGRDCKPGRPLQALVAQAFGTSAAVAAYQADAALAQQEADLLIRGCSHPLVACGIMHWARHMMLAPGVYDDAKVLKIAPIYGRMACALAERWPLLAPNALALLRVGLQLSPPYVDAIALAPCRAALAGQLADIALHAGYVLPVLAFVRHGIESNGLESAVGRTFLCRLVESLACTRTPTAPPSFSLLFALALLRFIDTFQRKHMALAEALKRPYESILYGPVSGTPSPAQQQLGMTFETMLADIGRLMLARDPSISNADVIANKTAGFTAGQTELFRLVSNVVARIKERKTV